MPKFQIDTSHGTYEIEADREPTQQEALDYIGNHVNNTSSPVKNEYERFKDEKLADANHGFGYNLVNKGLVEPATNALKMAGKIGSTLYGASKEQQIKPYKYLTSPIQTAKDDLQTGLEGTSRAVGDLVDLGRSAINDPNKYLNPVQDLILKSLTKPSEEQIKRDYQESKYQEIAQQNRKTSAPVQIPGSNVNENSAEALSLGVDPVAIGEVIAGKLGLKAAANAAAKVSEATGIGKPKTIEDVAAEYRKVLAPGKKIIKNVETKGGKDLNDSYKLAAEEGLIIEKGPDNKLDTAKAREQLQEKTQPIHDQLSDALASNPEKQFDVRELGEEAKRKARQQFKNDADYDDAVKQIDREVEATIKHRGENVSGTELNEFKQGQWGKGYNAMAPNANKVSRVLGNTAKEAIEKAYPDAKIKELNEQLGQYNTLRNILEDAHGNVVAKGKLGKYVAQGLGALIGHSVGLPVAGELGGAWAGGKVSDYMVDPERITKGLANKAQALNPVGSQPPPLPTRPPPLPADAQLESLFKGLSEKTQRRRLADSIKSEELGKQAADLRNDLMLKQMVSEEGLIPKAANPNKVLPTDIQDMINNLKPEERDALIKRFLDQSGL
jgi:hypothetical protein